MRADRIGARPNGRDASPGRLFVVLRTTFWLAFGGIFGWAWASAALRRRADDHAITDRQREILALVGRGMSSKQIALHIGLSEETVKTHVKRAMNTLGAPTRAAAVAKLSGQSYAATPARPRRSATRSSAVTISATSSSNGT